MELEVHQDGVEKALTKCNGYNHEIATTMNLMVQLEEQLEIG